MGWWATILTQVDRASSIALDAPSGDSAAVETALRQRHPGLGPGEAPRTSPVHACLHEGMESRGFRWTWGA